MEDLPIESYDGQEQGIEICPGCENRDPALMTIGCPVCPQVARRRAASVELRVLEILRGKRTCPPSP